MSRIVSAPGLRRHAAVGGPGSSRRSGDGDGASTS